MSLFACSKCDTVENTASSNFWQQSYENKPVLCSVCDPEIGKWHDLFDRRTYQEADYQLCPDLTERPRRIVCPKPDGWDYCEHYKKAKANHA